MGNCIALSRVSRELEYAAPGLVGDLLSSSFDGLGVGVSREDDGCKRIKVVITKQQLQELVAKRMPLEVVLSGLQRRSNRSIGCAANWKPQLETILEGME